MVPRNSDVMSSIVLASHFGAHPNTPPSYVHTDKKMNSLLYIAWLYWVSYCNTAVVPRCAAPPAQMLCLFCSSHIFLIYLFICLLGCDASVAGGGCPIAVRARDQGVRGVGAEARRPHRREDSKRRCFARPGAEEEGEMAIDLRMGCTYNYRLCTLI